MIWCVDHDAQRRNLEIYALQSMGLTATGFECADSLWKALQNELPDLVLMSAGLPGINVLEFLKRIRQSSVAGKIPIIMIARTSLESEVINCLDAGADDCLGSAYGMMEMVSRVKAVLRRVQHNNRNLYRAEGIVLLLNERKVLINNQTVQLSFKEFELLKHFMEHIGEVLTRSWLYETVWNGDYHNQSRTVDCHVQTLRKKLGCCGYLIEAVKNVGYRFKTVV